MREGAAVCIVFYSRKVLLMRRKIRDGDPWSGDMSFPGGFMRDGEDAITCALREFQEETGSEASYLNLLKVLDYFNTLRDNGPKVYPVLCTAKSKFEINPGDEMEYGGWYPIDNGIVINDPHRGKCLKFNDDIVWGLTFRILDYLMNNEEFLSKSK